MAGDTQACAGSPLVSVVIPVLNDARPLSSLLSRLRGSSDDRLEIIVVDGGSTDDSAAVAESGGCLVVPSRTGRGHQLAEGIARAQAPWIWMLHADSEPAPQAVHHVLTRPADVPGWGRFSVSLAPGTGLEAVATAMNWRSRLSGICTGDQGIFVHRSLLDRAGGMPRQSLMEDIELSRRLMRWQRPDSRPECITSSPRRWRRRGIVRTVLSMWQFRLRYWLGADPERLAREYYGW
jgi:rSAM/selenodomain-associated transferase 2